MYILEVLLKAIVDRKTKDPPQEEQKEYVRCNHIFLPIDSSGKRLACSKCGQYAELEEVNRR
jgi:hypothetical protein